MDTFVEVRAKLGSASHPLVSLRSIIDQWVKLCRLHGPRSVSAKSLLRVDYLVLGGGGGGCDLIFSTLDKILFRIYCIVLVGIWENSTMEEG